MANDDTFNSVRPLTQPRTQQACRRCRTLKARCLPSDQGGTCQRCLSSKRDCIWPEGQHRTRPPRGPSRISQVEKKIDGLVARIAGTPDSRHDYVSNTASGGLGTSTSSKASLQGYASPVSTPDTLREETRVDETQFTHPLHELQRIHDFDSETVATNEDRASSLDLTSSSKDDPLVKKLMDHPEMETLFEQYRPMSMSFPFVPIAPDMTAQDLCKRKPMLLLAMMTVAAWENRDLHAVLDHLYKFELASRVLIQPRKNVALLQSILVHLAWYHYFLDSRFHHESTLHLAIGLASELKLEPDMMPHLLPGRNNYKRVRGGRDGHRALLGCYYLASVSSNSLQIPNRFGFSQRMRQYVGQSVQQSPESDKLLCSLVNAQELEDQFCSYLRLGPQDSLNLAAETILQQLNEWESRLNQWKKEASETENMQILIFSYNVVEMDLYHAIFRRFFERKLYNYEALCPIFMTSCLEAGRAALDGLIGIPMEDFYLIPFSIWLRMPYIMIVMAMLTTPSEHHLPSWDPKAARDRVRLDLFIESLCFRMQGLTTVSSPAQRQLDFWLATKSVLQSVGRWYKKVSQNVIRPVPASSLVQKDGRLEGCGTEYVGQEAPFAGSSSHETMPTAGWNYMPQSIDSSSYLLPDGSVESQLPFPPVMCPMMGVGAGFDLDQFLNSGYWGNSFDGELFNFHA